MIASGQTILASDYVSTSAGAGDSGKVPKLNASGVLDSSFISAQTPLERLVSSFTADEAISAKKAVYLSDGSGVTLPISTTTGTGIGFTSATEWLAQTFTTTVGMNFINSITFRANNDYCNNVTASIRAVSGNVPTGADIGGITGVVACGGRDSNYTVTFSTPVPITGGNVYAMVLRTSNTSGSPWGYLERSNTNPYAGGNIATSSDSGSTWSANTSYDLYSNVSGSRARAGKIGLANDGSDVRAKNFIGFADELIAKDGTGKVILSGFVSGLTGMTAGATAYLGTDGGVNTSGTKKIGLAISSTEMLIKHDNA